MQTKQIAEILGLNSIQLRLEKDWGSLNPENRRQIRGELRGRFPEAPSLESLERLPEVPGRSISISHTKTIGGYSLTEDPVHLGFDVELNSRLESCQLSRVSRYREEMENAPNPAFLWTAKEAAFKSLSRRSSVKALSDIRVEEWSEISPKVFRFQAYALTENALPSEGVCWADSDFTYSLSVVRA